MLKTNLERANLLSHGLLLVFPALSTLKTEKLHTFIKEEKGLYENCIKADTLSQPSITDSSGYLLTTRSYNAAAPKVSLNKHAAKFVKSFLVREDEDLQKTKQRSASYFKVIDEVFSKYNLPVELKYLAVVESDLKTSAVSKVGAKGVWQFMPETARDLGLKMKGKYDERTHFYKSTVAAAKYLKDLYGEFNDWLLVLAAYNSGPGPICKAIKKSGSKNFWALQEYLPEESRGHVKRFIGTHYFFEGQGSLVTLTKSETIKYLKQVEDFKTEQNNQFQKDSTASIAVAIK